MNILYIGDIMGGPGIRAVQKTLPGLVKTEKIDFVIAQGENVTDGRGISLEDFQKLKSIGVDFITGGNWSGHIKDIVPSLSDPEQPIIRPANYPEGTPGLGWKTARTSSGKNILVVSLLGQIVGKDSDKPVDNPLRVIDEILAANKDMEFAAKIVNFHGDYSSEKRVIGYYLDGRVTGVVGDHWHVPTADAMVLPEGTAHITDVGMCGVIHSSLGVKTQNIIERWRDGARNRNELEDKDPLQFNSVLITADPKSGLATNIRFLQRIL